MSPTNARHKPKVPSFASRRLEAVEGMLQRASERGGPLRYFLHLAHLIVVGIRRSQLTRMAAALAYRTIFGLIPVLVISLLVMAVFASKAQVHDTLSDLLKLTGIDRVALEPEKQIIPGLNPFSGFS